MVSDAILDRRTVRSASEPGRHYLMVRTLSGWQHADLGCRGWMERGHCHHVEELNMSTDPEEARAVVVSMNPLALIDDVDLEEVMNKKLIPVPEWTYSFQVKGQTVEGVSIKGAQDATRALSTKGEAIREQWVRLEKEDEREAYFLACAARYAVAPDGREICMDTAIRSKRQPKFIKLRDGGEQFNEYWYEVGVAKALRNAVEALLPEALKQWMKQQAKAAAKGANGRPQRERQPTPAERAMKPAEAREYLERQGATPFEIAAVVQVEPKSNADLERGIAAWMKAEPGRSVRSLYDMIVAHRAFAPAAAGVEQEQPGEEAPPEEEPA